MREQDGFTLVGLMVAVLVINVLLGVAATSWVTIDRRAREAEAIWRGRQIARAIDCYREDNASEPLEQLDQLVEADCLRRTYEDPLAEDGQWRVLTRQDLTDGTVAELLGVTAPAGTGQESDAFDRAFGEISGQGDFRSRLGDSGQRGIVGVASGAAGEGLRSVNGRQRYGEWVFLASSTASGAR